MTNLSKRTEKPKGKKKNILCQNKAREMNRGSAELKAWFKHMRTR